MQQIGCHPQHIHI